MKIGFLTDTYFPQVNGVTFTIQAWKDELEKRGHEVGIYYPRGGYKPCEGEIEFPAMDFRFYEGYRLAIPWNISKKTKNLDILHQHGLYTMALAGIWSSVKNKTPKILTFHTPGDEYTDYLPLSKHLGWAYKKGYLLWERWLLNRYGKITTASPVIRDRLLQNKIKDVEILSNGLDLRLFHKVETENFRDMHGITAEKVIGFCGRLGYEKHVEDLIAAADEFEGQVLIAGEGPAKKYYEKLSEKKKNVKMLGFIPRHDLRQFYSALDVFVFPSFCETQGLVALESMACETPVIAVPVAALKTTIDDGETGYHFMPKDPKDLLLKVDKCYENMAKLRKACLKKARENSIKNTIDKLETIYSGII
jgi:1,2-diacylglycerol 3-alpha-glucosyltransferase